MQKFFLILYYRFERYFLKLTLKSENQTFTRRFMGHRFIMQNKWSYLSAIKEIYIDECYRISPQIKVSRILDIGANLGFSIAYFKNQYPSCSITAFEADPKIFELLDENIRQNHFEGVNAINGAAWITDGTMSFHQDHSQGGSLIQSELHKDSTSIKTYDLKKVIKSQDWDLLKIDVEGAEVSIIEHIQDELPKFKLIFIEYHERKGVPGQLSKLLALLERHNFKYSLSPIFGTANLFQSYESNDAFDLQLNIHAVSLSELSVLQQQ